MQPYIFTTQGKLIDPDLPVTPDVTPYICYASWVYSPFSEILIPKSPPLSDSFVPYVLRKEFQEDFLNVLQGSLPNVFFLTKRSEMYFSDHFSRFITSGGSHYMYTLPNSWVKPLSEADPETEVIPLYTQAVLPESGVVYTVMRIVDGDRLLLASLLPTPHTKLVKRAEVRLSLPLHLMKPGMRVRIDERLKPVLGSMPSVLEVFSGYERLFDCEFEIVPAPPTEGLVGLKSLPDAEFPTLLSDRIPLAYLIPVTA